MNTKTTTQVNIHIDNKVLERAKQACENYRKLTGIKIKVPTVVRAALEEYLEKHNH